MSRLSPRRRRWVVDAALVLVSVADAFSKGVDWGWPTALWLSAVIVLGVLLRRRWPLPAPPVLTRGGGSGLETWVEREYWLWPLPPPGHLRLTCQWLDQGITMTTNDLDAAPPFDAATRAQPLWPIALLTTAR